MRGAAVCLLASRARARRPWLYRRRYITIQIHRRLPIDGISRITQRPVKTKPRASKERGYGLFDDLYDFDLL